MAWIGSTVRYFLNINTIWGLMILISFAAAIIQHYAPTTSWIPAEMLRPGENQVQIEVTDSDKAVHSIQSVLSFDGTEIHVSGGTEEPAFDSGEPWVVGSRSRAGMPALVWDCHKYGSYRILINGQPAKTGKLVNLRSVTDAAFDYAKVAFDLALGFVAVFVLFLGLMKVGEAAGLVQAVAFLLRPIINFLFPGIPKGHPASGAIVMNITTSILGLGNAATPFGLKAIEELQKINPRKDTATDAMCMLVGYNTAGFALLPTTLLALRKSAGCTDPFAIIGTCMLAGASSTIAAMLMVKLLGRLPAFRVQYSAEELASIADQGTPPSEKAEVSKEDSDE